MFCREELGIQITETYYHNGLRNSIYKEYSNGELFIFGKYINDTITGTWYYFDDLGRLWLTKKDLKKTTNRFTPFTVLRDLVKINVIP